MTGPASPETEERRGSPADRGRGEAIGFDVERLRGQEGLEPLVQYLTYIQSERGEHSHLLFVRQDDLAAMAAVEGQDLDGFLDRLDSLGVLVSQN